MRRALNFVPLLFLLYCSTISARQMSLVKQFATVLQNMGILKGHMVKVKSASFNNGEPIPVNYTGEGADVSPPLSWENVPENVQSFAVICDDPDAPREKPWVHWVLYDIPANVTELPQGVQVSSIPGAKEGMTDSGEARYHGPYPPSGHGVHHYHFKVYALDVPTLNLRASASKEEVLTAMEGHILAKGELVGTYERK